MTLARAYVRRVEVAAVLAVCSLAACDGNALQAGSPADAGSRDADAGSPDADAGVPDAGPTPDAQPADGEDCWGTPAPPPVSSILPHSSVADSCAVGASAATTWTAPMNPYAASSDNAWRIVGRWSSCGRMVPGLPAHSVIEFDANNRWRLLTIDAGTGALVPLSGPGAVSGYYDFESSGAHDWPMNVRGELPGQSLWSGKLLLAAAGDALRFENNDSPDAVYGRTTPSPSDGADNPPPTTDGHCSMVGSWDVPADGNTFSRAAAVFSFDGAGNFVGDPEGSNACGGHAIRGTYALSSSAFQIVTSTGLGYCDGWYSASYTATFDASCNQVALSPTYDECGDRAYFRKPTTLTRRPAGADGGVPRPPDAGTAGLPIFDSACWESRLPPAPKPMIAPSAVADLCTAAASATDWAPIASPPEVIDDYRGYIVGRWAACGVKIAQLPAHAGIEFGANGRWRLLAIDAGSGGLVPLAKAGATSGYYYAMAHDRSQSPGALMLVGELPTEDTWTVFVRYSGHENQAIRFDSQLAAASDPVGPIYARAAAASDNGAGNAPPTADGSCAMAGTWDVVTKDDALGAPPAVIAFDDVGNFVGGPAGADLCHDSGMYGTYALASGRFQLTTGYGMRPCEWWMRAVYAAAFDATCNQLSVTRISDACGGSRGYFDEPTTLTRRVP